jgi:hypothetical protein
MKTVYELERELKQLRSRVKQMEGVATPSQDTVSAIVEPNSDDDKLIGCGGGGSGWAAAVAGSVPHSPRNSKPKQFETSRAEACARKRRSKVFTSATRNWAIAVALN